MGIDVISLDVAREVIRDLEARVEQLEEIEVGLVEDFNKLLDESREIIQLLENRVEQLEEDYGGLIDEYNELIDDYEKMEEYYTTDPIVILDEKQWNVCWKAMCKRIGSVPSWCDYPKYLGHGVVHADSANYPKLGIYDGIEIWFETPEDAMAFKLVWS